MLSNPATGDELDSTGDRQACVERRRIRYPIIAGVTEDDCVAGAPFSFQVRRGEMRLTTFIVLVEIDKRRLDALVLDALPRVDVRSEFLADRITQYVKGLTLLDLGS